MPRDLNLLVQASPLRQPPRISPPSLKLSDVGGLLKRSDTIDFDDETEKGSNRDRMVLDRKELHTYSQVLTPSYLEACLALEEAIFPPAERCSREKLKYRLQSCNELCLGLFTILSDLPSPEQNVTTYAHARSIDETHFPGQKQVLIGMIIATKVAHPFVTDESMEMPEPNGSPPSPPQQRKRSSPPPPLFIRGRQISPQDDTRFTRRRIKGHDGQGKTIAIHTLGILPYYQKRGLGKTLLRGYVQRMEQQHVGRRIALIAHEGLVPMYESLDFLNKGKSDVKLGGGGWKNMVFDLKKPGKVVYGRPSMY